MSKLGERIIQVVLVLGTINRGKHSNYGNRNVCILGLQNGIKIQFNKVQVYYIYRAIR